MGSNIVLLLREEELKCERVGGQCFCLTEMENSGYWDRRYACVDAFAWAWKFYKDCILMC
jgi:hypothetical protein